MKRAKGTPDLVFTLLIFTLVLFGLVMIFSASQYTSYVQYNTVWYYFKKQLLWSVFGTIAFLLALAYDYRELRRYTGPLILIAVILCILVVFIGVEVKGAQRQLRFGWLNISPSEVLKFAIIVFLAKHFQKNYQYITDFKKGFLPVVIIMALADLLVLLQKDLGTTLAISGTIFALLMIAGARPSHLTGLGILGILGVLGAIFLEEYRRKRFIGFWYLLIGDENKLKGYEAVIYQVKQSLYAIGSGGIFGVGLGRSHQKMFYLPEQHTDFIFAIIGEELGLVGTIFVVSLFLAILYRGLKLAHRAPDVFGFFLVAGFTCMMVIPALINIAVATGVFPVTGIPLPFISYSGSSLIINMTAAGIIVNVSCYRRGRSEF
ncbi:cell division protein FtsW [Carboxydothermus islandicus]|uniref:Probable peptidoglycan glycosyltransferase FtsW n=1 Tax=Carboxydothermus islandicus TaxID=661089 RepID=A0A1L8D3U6_9THEO|nr:putative lipid II flippase FtsW [Carboxydothermus islandicus]GAV25751.1 cell division protein FtsW [Carboxydothermus islandicus]